MTRRDVLAGWRSHLGDLPSEVATHPGSWESWQLAQLNDRHHIAWGRSRQVLWLAQQFIVPEKFQDYPISGLAMRLALRWWAEDATIFVNGECVASGDLFDFATRVLFDRSVSVGDSFNVALRLESPYHDDGALVASELCCERLGEGVPEPGFVADEVAIAYNYLTQLQPEKTESISILHDAIDGINWETGDRDCFDTELDRLRETLAKIVGNIDSKINCLGHAHLDMAWLWPVKETWDAAQRTFESVLGLQADFPELIYTHSTPALYAWVEDNRPDLFDRIRQKVDAGTWSIDAGLWVEPELNIVSGEAIARHILYGQRYVKAKFGRISSVAWLPDSFGFCWQLPQLLREGGIEYFVTQKLKWNDTTEFPDDWFLWQSPDGTTIPSLMSAYIGQDTNAIAMTDYGFAWQKKTQNPASLWLPGMGDRGGGPTRDMLEVWRRWQQSPVFPKTAFTTAKKYLDDLDRPTAIWNDELYLEYHRGCYTNHADQKWYNRQCERLLYQAELFASIAAIVHCRGERRSPSSIYPQTELETAWKQVLFNQFHDILPGSAIPEVYEEADRDWNAAKQTSTDILARSLAVVAANIQLPTPPNPQAVPVTVFNPLNWTRSQVVSVPLPPSPDGWYAVDTEGNRLPSQQSGDRLLVWITKVPSVGYKTVWIVADAPQTRMVSESRELVGTIQASIGKKISQKTPPCQINNFDRHKWVLENAKIRATIDPKTGNIASLVDKTNSREVLAAGKGNQLQAFSDKGQYWDAWNIDPNYEQHPLAPAKLISIDWVETGEVRSRLRVVREIGRSQFSQDYILDIDSPLLKIETTVDWQERHVLVKAAFEFNFSSEVATYEMPCGAIARSTTPQTPAEKAKWEVPALQWADLSIKNEKLKIKNSEFVLKSLGGRKSTPPTFRRIKTIGLNPEACETENGFGVSILNDCKHGYDAKPNQLRLSLLRGSTWPDPNSDLGKHEFAYAIYPHAGGWKQGGTVRQGYEFNYPLLVVGDRDICDNASLPHTATLLDISADNFILTALKRAEDDRHAWILRGYECHGDRSPIEFSGELGLNRDRQVNLLEEPIASMEETATSILDPWKIASYRLVRSSEFRVQSSEFSL